MSVPQLEGLKFMLLPCSNEPAKFMPEFSSSFPRLLLTLLNLVSIYDGVITTKKSTKVLLVVS